MKLYHFAPVHMLQSILSNGLTLGRLPIVDDNGNMLLISPCQWLTKDGRWDKQSWATQQLVDYDRTAYRLLISIPKSHRKSLVKAHDYLPQLPGENKRLITDWEGSENWFLYFGRIPPGWIRKVEQKGAHINV